MKFILVHVDPTPEGVARARAAIVLAEKFPAKARALILAPRPAASNAPSVSNIETMLPADRDRAQSEFIEARTRAAHDLGMECVTLTTDGDRLLIDAATAMRPADLIVAAPPIRDKTHVDDDIFESALFQSGRPLLIVPRKTQHAPIGEHVVVAWKDCREAARAIHDSIPILQHAASVRILAVKSPGVTESFAGAALKAVSDALIAHGAPVVEATEIASDNPGEALLDAAKGSDLLVMGAYGRSRMEEIIFGGVTRDVLAHAEIPVFMAH